MGRGNIGKVNRYILVLWFVLACTLINLSAAQDNEPGLQPSPNVNMVSGILGVGGDPFLQRQNEPSIAVSTRNAMHLVAGTNDYRTVDVEFPDDEPPGNAPSRDSWLGLYESFDGGKSWRSSLLPGYPQQCQYEDGTRIEPAPSPLCEYDAAADPTVRAGTNGLFYYSGIAFQRGDNPDGAVFVSRLIDLNNYEGSDFEIDDHRNPIKHIETVVVDRGDKNRFLDKPWMAVDIPRNDSGETNVQQMFDETASNIPCGNVYIAYSEFQGESEDLYSHILLSRSADCGETWSQPVQLTEGFTVNQGVSLGIDPRNGHVYVAWRQFQKNGGKNSIQITRSTNGGESFVRAVKMSEIQPFDQAPRPVLEEIVNVDGTKTIRIHFDYFVPIHTPPWLSINMEEFISLIQSGKTSIQTDYRIRLPGL